MTEFDAVITATENAKDALEAFALSPACDQQDHRILNHLVGAFGVLVQQLYKVQDQEMPR